MILFLPLQIFDIGPDHLLICVIEKKNQKCSNTFSGIVLGRICNLKEDFYLLQ